jgi:FkbM family methyltransferase
MDTVFFDIGSGDGKRAQNWLTIDRKAFVFCFDPIEQNYLAAKKRSPKTRIGPRGLERLHAVQAAVTASAQKIDQPNSSVFYFANDLSSCSLLPFDDANITRWKYPPGKIYFRTTHTLEVPTVRMDKFLIDRRIDKVAFVRIETQGTALDVLKSFGKRIQCVMEFAIKVHCDSEDSESMNHWEIYQGQTRKDDLMEFMKKHGFSIYDKVPWSRGQEEIIWFVNRLAPKDLKHFDL